MVDALASPKKLLSFLEFFEHMQLSCHPSTEVTEIFEHMQFYALHLHETCICSKPKKKNAKDSGI